jgi:cell division protein FtsB
MAPTTPEERVAARQTVPCAFCSQPAGRVCLTASGKTTSVHAPRIHDYQVWLTRQPEVDQLSAERDGLKAQVTDLTRRVSDAAEDITSLQAERTTLLQRIHDLEHPTPTRTAFGIGINEKPTAEASPLPFTLEQLEADAGVKFAYVHEYFRYPTTGVATDVVKWCEKHLAAGRIPVPTIKLPGDDWAGGAAGKYDATIGATSDALAALAAKYGRPVISGLQNEPDNDGKALAAWSALLAHVSPLIRRPGLVEFWVNYTGWAQLFGSASAWKLEDLPTEGVDGVAFDPYLSLGGSTQTKMTDMVAAYAKPIGAWAKTRGVKWGIWETGLNEDAAKMTTFPGVKTQLVDFAVGCADAGAAMWFYWNNKVAPTKAKPVTEDWRITTTLPADKHRQLTTLMRQFAPA